jgi:hypothetical protein
VKAGPGPALVLLHTVKTSKSSLAMNSWAHATWGPRHHRAPRRPRAKKPSTASTMMMMMTIQTMMLKTDLL